MPSVQQELGKYVSVRVRKDGTARVLFEVPARLRPSDWPSTRPLPIEGRRGDLSDAAEVARIQADAKRLYAELMAARTGAPKVDPNARTFTTLIKAWQNSQAWKDNKPRTNKGYTDYLREVTAWETANNPDPATFTVPDVEAFIGIYDDRPTTRYHVRKVLRMVMQQAVRLKWRSDNPVDEVKVAMPKSRVTIWEQEDVDTYVWAALAAGNPDLAAIILTEWEIGQRLTDVVLFRRGAEYRAEEGVFSFDQSKTDQPVAIPVSERLRGILAHIERKGSIYLFHDKGTGRAFRDVDRLSHVFEDVRTRFVLPSGGRRLVLRAIRHSCVVQLARHGAEVPEIVSVTGHSLSSANEILKVYMPRDSRVAMNAQRKRGLVA